MNVINTSAESEGRLRSWLPHNLDAKEIVFLPDACAGKSPLPTGTTVLTTQTSWRELAVSDCGCGMRLIKSHIMPDELTSDVWDGIAYGLQQNKGGLGDLGGGNHFLDALLPYDEDVLYFLIHTGSRQESGTVDDLTERPDEFDSVFQQVVEWAESNRQAVEQTVSSIIGETELILDLPHNTFEKTEQGVVTRKGSVRLQPGEFSILPSHMSGDVSLVRATEKIKDILFSMSHGTGRTMSRGDSKDLAATFDFTALREKVLFPNFLEDASLTTEGPHAYRGLDDCLELIGEYAREVKRFSVI